MASADVVVKFNHLPKLLRDTPRLADQAIGALALEGERFVKQGMENSPATGRTYITTNPDTGSTVSHTASIPGAMPRIDTGNLINSIATKKAGFGKRRITAGTDYAFMLEFGTSKMEARPFMMPMVVELQRIAPTFFDDLIQV